MQPMPQVVIQPIQFPVYPQQQVGGGGYPPPPYPHSGQPFQPPVQQQPSHHQNHNHNHNQQYPTAWLNRNFHTYLQNATSFHVKQKVELVEAILGWETENKYTVKDQNGNKVFYVGEESNLCGVE